jgi:predicted transposase YdaD
VEGRAEGEVIGESRGRAEQARATATMMKAKKLDNKLIAEMTGLSLSEIERLD